MKKLNVLFSVLACFTMASCMHHDRDINIAYKETDRYYSMNAHFDKIKTRQVESYLSRRMDAGSNLSFANTQSDALFTLDDDTKFYMKKSPGHIKIKLDKRENSYAAYHSIKMVCEGMKKELGE